MTQQEKTSVEKSEDQWREKLTPQQYYVLRQSGTERAFSGEYWDHHGDGIYSCAGCGLALFDSQTKFDSRTGWPSYYDAIQAGNIEEVMDHSHGMVRTEVRCSRCGGHLGHLFKDGPRPTGLRYCINSAALDFVDREQGKADADASANATASPQEKKQDAAGH